MRGSRVQAVSNELAGERVETVAAPRRVQAVGGQHRIEAYPTQGQSRALQHDGVVFDVLPHFLDPRILQQRPQAVPIERTALVVLLGLAGEAAEVDQCRIEIDERNGMVGHGPRFGNTRDTHDQRDLDAGIVQRHLGMRERDTVVRREEHQGVVGVAGGGEHVDIRAVEEPAVTSEPEPIELDVAFEDEHLLVINKPAGMAVHGGSGQSVGVIESLRHAMPDERRLELVDGEPDEVEGATAAEVELP